MGEERVVKEIRAALQKDTRINLHRYPIQIAVQNDGDLILDGVVADIAAKKLALVAAAEIHGVQRIVDRLKVTPAEKMGDAEIRDHVCKVLIEESALERCFIHGFVGGGFSLVRSNKREKLHLKIAKLKTSIVRQGNNNYNFVSWPPLPTTGR